MPIYVFECNDCGERVELLMSVNDPAPEKCESCGGSLRKIFLPVGIVFKGSGFYATDNRSSSAGACKPAPSESDCSTCKSACADAGGEKKSEPVSKAESSADKKSA